MAAERKVQVTNFTLYQGETFRMVLRLTDPTTGEPVDYTGATARGQMRVNFSDESPAGVFTCAFTDAANGVLQISMTDAETSALNFNKADYDIEVVQAGGIVQRILMGKVTLSREATK